MITAALPLTILIVDEHESARCSLGRDLAARGCAVLEAPDNEGALAHLRRHPYQVDLLLADVPTLLARGLASADRLLEECPGLRLVFLGGRDSPDESEDELSDSVVPLLRKPLGHGGLEGVLGLARERAVERAVGRAFGHPFEPAAA